MNNSENKHNRELSTKRKYKQFFIFLLFLSVAALGYRFSQKSPDQNAPQAQAKVEEIPSDDVSKKTQREVATENTLAETEAAPSIKLRPQASNEVQVASPEVVAKIESPVQKNPPVVIDVSEVAKQEPAPQADLKSADESLFRFEFGVYNSRIDSQDQLTNEQAIFLSEINTSLQLDFLFPVDQQFQIFGRTKYNAESYSQLKKGSKIEDPKIGLFTYGIGADYVLSENLNVQIFAGQSQRVFIRAVAASQFEFVKVLSPELGLEASYNVLKNERISVNLGAGLKQVFSAQTDAFSTKSGTGYSANVSFMRKYKGVPIKMTVEYAADNIGSTIASQKRQEGRIGLGVDF